MQEERSASHAERPTAKDSAVAPKAGCIYSSPVTVVTEDSEATVGNAEQGTRPPEDVTTKEKQAN